MKGKKDVGLFFSRVAPVLGKVKRHRQGILEEASHWGGKETVKSRSGVEKRKKKTNISQSTIG